jgi:signal transduction histidine kinase
MTSTTVTAPRDWNAIRDPVVVLPVAVACGLGVGWLGVLGSASGWRIAADLLLAWTLIAVSLVMLARPRWRPARLLLAGTAFAVLLADLQWARSHALWTIGFLFEAFWVALLVQLVLTFPEGGPWSHFAWPVILTGYVLALAGQLGKALVSADGRDVIATTPQASVAHAIDRTEKAAAVVVALAASALVVNRMRHVSGPARRAQVPLHVVAVIVASAGIAWACWTIVDGSASGLETIARWLAAALPLAIVVGIARAGLRRRDASQLVVELRTEAEISMQERLARALGDPSLEIAYRLDNDRYVDSGGRFVELPRESDRAVTAVTARGEEVAILVHDPSLLDESALVESVRTTAGLVLENERLAAEVRSRLAEVRASRGRIVAAADAERRRIERNLHDGAQQRLVTLSVALGLEASQAEDAAASALRRAQNEVEAAIAELRELARGIHPTLLRDDGLAPAVEALARRTPVPVSVRAATRDRLPESVELAAYFVVSEALTNVVKHASATKASVLLELAEDTLRVTVADDGVGGAGLAAGSGLAGLRDRLEALDATLVIESPIGSGTTVSAWIPCAS